MHLYMLILNFARHVIVLQTSAEVWKKTQTLPDILYNIWQGRPEIVHRMSGIKHDICWFVNWGNVWHGFKMSGRAMNAC